MKTDFSETEGLFVANEKAIVELKSRLAEYCAKPNHNKDYVLRTRALLNDLVKFHNSYEKEVRPLLKWAFFLVQTTEGPLMEQRMREELQELRHELKRLKAWKKKATEFMKDNDIDTTLINYY